MKIAKLLVIVMAMVAVGTLVLPSTVSLFAGQHYWYNITGTDNQVPCQKCHADVFEELNHSSFHKAWSASDYSGGAGSGTADQSDCEACHRSNFSITYAEGGLGKTYTAGNQAHAASVVACMLCHQSDAYNATVNVSKQAYAGFYAGGFTNMSGYGSPYRYNTSTSNGTYAAHNAFVARAIENDTLQDSNEACIACHTHVPVKINFSHARSLEFNVGVGSPPITTDTGAHNWTITQWSTNGTAYAYIYGDTWGTNASTSYNSSVWPGNVSDVNYNYGS